MTELRKGLFISFEGADGSGKSTQMSVLASRLRSEGYTVLENREPGGTPIGQQIRRILLDAANHDMAPMTELLLMFASRTQAAAQWILPALERGEIVLSDRFTDSSLAYQGEARQIGFDTVLALHRLALGKLMPDITICVELPVEESLSRAHGRNKKAASVVATQSETRIDEHSLEFHRLVSQGYRRISALDRERFHVVDGRGAIEEIAGRVWAEVFPLLQRKQLDHIPS